MGQSPPRFTRWARLLVFVALALSAASSWAQTAPLTLDNATAFSTEGGRARFHAPSGTLVFRGGGERRGTITFTELPEAFTGLARKGGVVFSVRNTSEQALACTFRIKGVSAANVATRHQQIVEIPPGARGTFPIYTFNYGVGPYWGMQGLPVYGPSFFDGEAMPVLEPPAALEEVSVTISPADRGMRLEITGLTAFAPGDPVAQLVAHPFIDELGQFTGQDWDYKVTSVEDLKARDAAEAQALAESPAPRGFDDFGGWADGPQLEGTGRFRTEKVGGRWWLVTPEGRLFFSLGVNCVHRGDSTFLTGRDDWFAWRPEPDGPFAGFMREVSGVHSRAEAIGETGLAANFYGINLMRKWGDAWEVNSRDRAMARLRAWGFNTVANWSSRDMLTEGDLPFTVTGYSGEAVAIAGSSGYWGKLKDVFDPGFVARTHEAVERSTQPWRDNPRVIGYFIDNEMSWSGLAEGVLASPPEQPARMAFIDDLRAKYETLEALATAWETEADHWDALRLPTRGSDAARADASAFTYRFARRYFETIDAALAEHAPEQLYMGCRFTLMYMPDEALRACAEHVDVISINAYLEKLRPGFLEEYDKPVIIGEFHFGARDRGMFHPGLVAAEDQAARGTMYAHYVESVAKSPVFVGCHWFQYMDQPVTGRTLDGENFNIGLMNVCDIPYPELTTTATALHGRLYPARHGDDW